MPSFFLDACCDGDLEHVQALHRAGCDVAAVDSTGETALHVTPRGGGKVAADG